MTMFAGTGSSTLCRLFILVSAALCGGQPSALAAHKKVGQVPPITKLAPPTSRPEPLTHGFSVKPSEVSVPDGVPLGKYLRMIRPFPNWTLICDENLAKKQKVCNISQTIVDKAGATIFSWSLAAAQNGMPFFIMRVPPNVGRDNAIKINLGDGGATVPVKIEGCDAQVCIGYLPVVQRVREAVKKGRTVGISYQFGNSANGLSFRAPLSGLAAALNAI